MHNMKLDWTELLNGADSVFEKTAQTKVSSGGVKKPMIKGVAAGTALGAGAAGAGALGSGVLGTAMNSLGGLSGIAALLPLLASGGKRKEFQRPPTIHVHTGKRPTALDALPENQVGGFNSMNYGEPIKVAGDIITDALTAAVRNRLANRAIDAVTTAPNKIDSKGSSAEDKKLEIVSKYPEMEELLKKEENKAYLEKLLKE